MSWALRLRCQINKHAQNHDGNQHGRQQADHGDSANRGRASGRSVKILTQPGSPGLTGALP